MPCGRGNGLFQWFDADAPPKTASDSETEVRLERIEGAVMLLASSVQRLTEQEAKAPFSATVHHSESQQLNQLIGMHCTLSARIDRMELLLTRIHSHVGKSTSCSTNGKMMDWPYTPISQPEPEASIGLHSSDDVLDMTQSFMSSQRVSFEPCEAPSVDSPLNTPRNSIYFNLFEDCNHQGSQTDPCGPTDDCKHQGSQTDARILEHIEIAEHGVQTQASLHEDSCNESWHSVHQEQGVQTDPDNGVHATSGRLATSGLLATLLASSAPSSPSGNNQGTVHRSEEALETGVEPVASRCFSLSTEDSELRGKVTQRAGSLTGLRNGPLEASQVPQPSSMCADDGVPHTSIFSAINTEHNLPT